jgi:6-phosphogluconolactonase
VTSAAEREVNGATVVVVDDASAGAALAAERIAAALAAAVAARGRADWVTTGGSTATGIYRRLMARPLVDTVPWPLVHVWWGDDRYVPRDHPWSNVKALDDILLEASDEEEGTAGIRRGVPLPFENLHAFPTGEAIGEDRGAAWCAEQIAEELRRSGIPHSDGWPVFDLILLGVGADGHVLSVFPGSSAFDSSELALAIPAPTHIEPHVERVTLNPAVLGVAHDILTGAYGAGKAAVIAEVLGPVHDPRRWPAQLAARAGATWIVDEAAASALPR